MLCLIVISMFVISICLVITLVYIKTGDTDPYESYLGTSPLMSFSEYLKIREKPVNKSNNFGFK